MKKAYWYLACCDRNVTGLIGATTEMLQDFGYRKSVTKNVTGQSFWGHNPLED